jgi:uncharacterized Zn finger protein (UPF0148 family)
MAYKEKTCPACGTKHKKRGEFCSRSCGNKRNHTEDTKEKIAAAKREWHATSETAAVAAHNYTSKRINGEPDPVPPVTPTPVRHNQFVQDGDLWEEC